MKKLKVIYFINYAPIYRHKFLTTLAKTIDLTVVSYSGKEVGLKDPADRIGYKYICLKRYRFLKFNFNIKEFTLANGQYDVIIVGYTLWNPFRMINLFRHNKKVIAEGLIYGKSNNIITRFLRKLYLNKSKIVLVYSKLVYEKLKHEICNEIIVFNNTSFFKKDLIPIKKILLTINLIFFGLEGIRREKT